MSDHPEEFNEFLFTPKDQSDGSRPTGEDERRRLEALRYYAEQFAKQEGLVPIKKGEHPQEPTENTERSAEITQQARVLMPVDEEKVRNTIERARRTPDGEEEMLRIRLGFLDDLGEAVKAVAKSPGQVVDITKTIITGGVRIGIRVGKLIKLKVTAGEEESLSDSDEINK